MSWFDVCTSASGLLGQLGSIYVALETRRLIHKKNGPELIDVLQCLHDLIGKVRNKREQLESVCASGIGLHESLDLLEGFEKNLGKHIEDVDEESQKRTRKGPMGNFLRATRTREIIELAREVAKEVQGFMRVETAASISTIALHQNIPHCICSPARYPHLLRPVGRAPVVACKTGHAYLAAWVKSDFTSRCPRTNEALTLAGKVRDVVLRGIRGECSPFTGHCVVQVTGDSGIGKTSAIRSLVRDDDQVLRSIYCDPETGGGIHYFSWNQTSTSQEMIESFAARVQRSGGAEHAARVRRAGHLQQAIHVVWEFFYERDTLFFIDEEDHLNWNEITLCLASLSTCSYRSAVIFARQSKVLKGIGHTLHLEAIPKGFESKQVFFNASGLTSEDFLDGDCRRYFDEILVICEGFVICLNNVGNSVRLRREACEEPLAYTLKWYLQRYRQSLQKVEAVQVCRKKRPYEAMIAVVLEMLSPAADEKKIRLKSHTMPDLFASLCVMTREEWLPYSELSKYWNLSEEDAEAVGMLFGKVARIGYHEEREDEAGKKSRGFRLHHRGLAYCIAQSIHKGVLESSRRRWRERL